MSNEQNLIPLNRRTMEERREIARKGGLASGEVRGLRATLRKSMESLLNSNIESIEALKKYKQSDKKRAKVVDEMCLKAVADFMAGKESAGKFVLELSKEDQKVEVALNGDLSVNPYSNLNEADLLRLAKMDE